MLSELDELRRKMKNGTLTEEERRRLEELENYFNNKKLSELEELRRKLRDGTITEEERKRLQELEEWEKNFFEEQDQLRD